MYKQELLTELIDSKIAAVLRVMLNASEELYLKEISTKSNVPITSVFRILNQLVEMDVLEKKEWKNSKVYKCKQNERVDFLKELFHEEFDGVRVFLDQVREMSSVSSVIMQGERSKDRANVLLIGQNINVEKVDSICDELRRHNFDLSYLTLTKEQYEQMSRMGMYTKGHKIS